MSGRRDHETPRAPPRPPSGMWPSWAEWAFYAACIAGSVTMFLVANALTTGAAQ